MRPLNIRKKQKGAILPLILMVVLLLSLSSLALIALGTQARLRTVKNVLEVSARFAADAGIDRALYLMNEDLQAGDWAVDDIPAYTSEPLTASNASYTVTHTGDLTNGYVVASVGQARGQTKTVQATIELTNLFSDNFAILTRGTLIVKNNSGIHGYNSSDLSETGVPASIGTISIQDNSLVMGNNGDVDGDIYIGPDGNPDDVVDLGKNTTVDGETFVMPQDYYLPTITPPDYTASQGSISGKNITLTSSDSGKYDGITIDNNGKLSINGDVTLYVTGDIDLKNDAEIEIDKNGALTLYFDGDFKTKNNAGINNETKIPSKAALYGTGQDQTIEIKNKNDLYSVIYAPNADVTVFNNIDVYGSIVVGSIDFKNSADIYYDKALKDVSLNDEGIRFRVTHWEEL